jgi:predicted nucleic acid-binding protein
MWEGWVLDEVDILAPDLLRYEVTSAIYRKSFKNLISWEDSQAVLAQFLALDIIMLDPAPLPTRAAELARQFCRSNAYDAFCMALAEHLNCAFWTADERLYHTTHPVFSLINILS